MEVEKKDIGMGSAAVNGVDPGAVEIHRRFGTDVINRSGISTRELQTTTNTIRHLKHALERLVHYSTKLKVFLVFLGIIEICSLLRNLMQGPFIHRVSSCSRIHGIRLAAAMDTPLVIY